MHILIYRLSKLYLENKLIACIGCQVLHMYITSVTNALIRFVNMEDITIFADKKEITPVGSSIV